MRPRTIEARLPEGGARRFIADRLFLNLGTRATIPGVPGLADARPLTHVDALEIDRLPSHLIVLGGGYVGVEFAQAFRRFGSEVTVLEFGTQLLGREDPDVATAVHRMFEEDGIDVVLGAETQVVEGRSGRRSGDVNAICQCTPRCFCLVGPCGSPHNYAHGSSPAPPRIGGMRQLSACDEPTPSAFRLPDLTPEHVLGQQILMANV